MGELTLISDFSLDSTSVSNIYIDEYMSGNNESQIKIYLFLLRNLSKGTPVSVITIADTFNYSVTDVERALMYMEKQGLMSLKTENGSITGLRLLPLRKKRNESQQAEGFILMETVAVPKKPEYTKEDMLAFKSDAAVDELLFVIQAYTGKPLTAADLKSVKYIKDELNFRGELIDFLVEYCVGRGKKSFSYMEKVAADWYVNGVKSVNDAKAFAFEIPDDVYAVFKAFSIKAGSRRPSSTEVTFVKKWTQKYAFTMDIIEKACKITLDKTHSVSFEYADAVLTDWNKKGVKHLSDIQAVTEKENKSKGRTNSNSFNNFTGREYDFAKLEQELLQN